MRSLGRLALTDSLTGLGNRRSWDQLLCHELARARRSSEPLSVGWETADALLRRTDQALYDVQWLVRAGRNGRPAGLPGPAVY